MSRKKSQSEADDTTLVVVPAKAAKTLINSYKGKINRSGTKQPKSVLIPVKPTNNVKRGKHPIKIGTDADRQRRTDDVVSNKLFIHCCELAGIPATRRQASKFYNGRGKAFSFLRQAQADLAGKPAA